MNFFYRTRFQEGFTLLELLVSTAIISLIMLVLLSMTNQTTQTWQYTTEKIEKFQEARDGFESMTRKLSQATLNTYWDYLGIVPSSSNASMKDKNNPIPRPKTILSQNYKDFTPLYYGRISELRFISGSMTGTDGLGITPPSGKYWPHHGVFFQAPLGVVDDSDATKTALGLSGDNLGYYKGMNSLLNTWGFFLQVDDHDSRPDFIDTAIAPKRWRSRLMEFMEPADKMMVSDLSTGGGETTTPSNPATTKWFSIPLTSTSPTTPPPVRVLAENIIALVILPKLSQRDQLYRTDKSYTPTYLSPKYTYDSTLTKNPGNTVGNDFAGVNPHNQLPPIVQVIMVAIDDRSAQRLIDRGSDKSPKIIGPDPETFGLFINNSQALETPDTGDLAKYEKELIKMGVTYRIFNSNVSIRGAKWSRSSKF
jgi:uncharacterized protein (TIGR02599 family)